MREYLRGGTIWRANREVICQKSDKKGRRVVVEKGELVEFRYPHDAHFRTKDEMYLFLKENDFLRAFDCIGEVMEPIRFRNQNTMAQILDAILYTEIISDRGEL